MNIEQLERYWQALKKDTRKQIFLGIIIIFIFIIGTVSYGYFTEVGKKLMNNGNNQKTNQSQQQKITSQESIGILNYNQKKLIYKEIKAYPNTNITIFKYEEKEIEQFVNQLKEIFQQAKWQVTVSTYLEDELMFSGIKLLVPNISNFGDEMESLSKGLNSAGIDLSIEEDKKYKTNYLSIVVGYRSNKY